MTIKAILFDIDGTLVDSNDRHVLAWQEAFRREGLEFDRETIHGQIGKGADQLIPALVPDADEALCERLSDAHGDIFKSRFLGEVRPFSGARQLLARARDSGRKVVLASSASQEELDHYLDLLDAQDIVSATTSADDVARTKPAPDIFATALKKVAPIAAEEALVVGDTPYDVEAAKRCGIAAIGLRSGGFDESSLRGAGAVQLYDNAAHLLREFEGSPLAGDAPAGNGGLVRAP